MERILEIADRFDLEGRPVSAESYGGGHINDTFLLKTDAYCRESMYLSLKMRKR